MRFWVAFARPHENTIVTDNNTTLSVHAYIMVPLSVTLFFSKAGVGNENGKKKKVYIRKTTTLHVQHTFLYISLPSLHDCDVKFPQVTFRGGRKHRLDYKFLFLPSKLGGGPQEFNSREIHLHSTEILHQSKKSRPTLKSFK